MSDDSPCPGSQRGIFGGLNIPLCVQFIARFGAKQCSGGTHRGPCPRLAGEGRFRQGEGGAVIAAPDPPPPPPPPPLRDRPNPRPPACPLWPGHRQTMPVGRRQLPSRPVPSFSTTRGQRFSIPMTSFSRWIVSPVSRGQGVGELSGP